MEINYFVDKMNTAGVAIRDKKFDSAIEVYEQLIGEIEADENLKNNEKKNLYAFEDTFEEILFKFFNGDNKKEISRVEYPIALMYLQYGALLFNLKKTDEALEALNKAKMWNPASINVYFELMEIYKATDKKDEYLECANEAFKYAYKAKNLGRCYRNLGFYYTEMKEYGLAVACLSVSLGYDRSANAQVHAELSFIEKMLGEKPNKPEVEETKELFEKNGIPFGPHKDVIGLASAYAKALTEQDDKIALKYFLEIVYDLTGDVQVGKMLKEME